MLVRSYLRISVGKMSTNAPSVEEPSHAFWNKQVICNGSDLLRLAPRLLEWGEITSHCPPLRFFHERHLERQPFYVSKPQATDPLASVEYQPDEAARLCASCRFKRKALRRGIA